MNKSIEDKLNNALKEFRSMLSGKLLYHSSHVKNKESIIKNGLAIGGYGSRIYFVFDRVSDTNMDPSVYDDGNMIQVIVKADSVLDRIWSDPEGLNQDIVPEKLLTAAMNMDDMRFAVYSMMKYDRRNDLVFVDGHVAPGLIEKIVGANFNKSNRRYELTEKILREGLR